MSEPRLPAWKLAVALAAGALGLCGGVGSAEMSPAPASGQTPTAPAALQVDQSAPLLMDEPAEEEAPKFDPKHPTADNGRCYVCHANYKEEPFVQRHAKANVGCVRCHGDSPEHVADEANLTPPLLMYWPSRVGFNCYGCHPQHKAPVRDVIVRWQERVAGKVDPKRVLCTDCHGEHRLHRRTIVWNKRTGALISKISPASSNAPPRSASMQSGGQTADGAVANDMPAPKSTTN